MKIELLKSCGSDLDVVNAARVSFDKHTTQFTDSERGLIKFLLTNRHGTPFEHNYFQFRVEAPIFVFREWHRHRVGHSYNEMSGRYVELEHRFYTPNEFREQYGKPGNYSYRTIANNQIQAQAMAEMAIAYEAAWNGYKNLLALGVAKEQARAVLPVGTYSQMYWSCNARSLMHFLGLRNKKDAMQEIRDLAGAAEMHFQLAMPVTAQTFIENGRVAP